MNKNVIKKLVSVAQQLDQQNLYKIADQVDEILRKIAGPDDFQLYRRFVRYYTEERYAPNSEGFDFRDDINNRLGRKKEEWKMHTLPESQERVVANELHLLPKMKQALYVDDEGVKKHVVNLVISFLNKVAVMEDKQDEEIQEWAIEAGRLGGIGAYNEVLGQDPEDPDDPRNQQGPSWGYE